MPDNLRRTILFASALQVLGSEHDTARRLEIAVRQRDPADILTVEAAIEELPSDERSALLARFKELCGEVPREALAA